MDDDIIMAAQECIGTKWVHQGRLVGAGLDCIGVIIHVAKTLGFKYQDIHSYPKRPNGVLQRALEEQMISVSLNDIRVGDVALIAFDEPCHVAMYVGLDIVHSYAQARRCVKQYYGRRWRDITTRVYRFKELA